MRRLHTAVPLVVWRSSGSRVRLPTRTTRLMFAAISVFAPSWCEEPRLLRCPVGVIGGSGHCRDRRRRLRVAALDAPDGEMAHDAVGDLQHARDLRERGRSGGEEEQVVDAVGLVVDLVGELAPAPRLVAVPLPVFPSILSPSTLARIRAMISSPRSSASSGSSMSKISYSFTVPEPFCESSHGLKRPRPLGAASGWRRDGRGEKSRQCSSETYRIGCVKRAVMAIAGALGLGALWRRRRRRKSSPSSRPRPSPIRPRSCARSSPRARRRRPARKPWPRSRWRPTGTARRSIPRCAVVRYTSAPAPRSTISATDR